MQSYATATSSSNPWNLAYDQANNLQSIKAPTGANWSLNYTSGSPHPYQPDSVVDAQKNTTNLGYDASWNLNSVADKTTNTSTTIDHNADGTVSDVKDARGNYTYYHYTNGDLTEVDPPAPLGKITMSYDAVSRLSQINYANGTTASYTYDGDDRITKIAYSDGTYVSYSYDGDGNLKTRTDISGRQTTYGYDALDRLTSKTGPGSDSSSYTYDQASNLLTLVDGSGTTTYHYNTLNLVDKITDPDNAIITFGYDNDHNLNSITYPNHVAISQSYDNSDRLTGITATNTQTSSTLENLVYSYNDPNTSTDSGLWWQLIDHVAGTTANYTYDSLNRLTSAAITGSQNTTYSYGYDPDGNITNYNGTSLGYNNANEINTSGYSYDTSGQEAAGGGFTYSYNAANQTTAITQNSNTQNIVYGDAGQNEVTNIGTTQFNNTELGVSSAAASGSTTYYTRNPRGALVDERIPGAKYYYLFDGLGSVIALVDTSGNVAKTYSYNPYGQQTATTGSAPNIWRYAGEYNLDPISSVYHIGARYYNINQGSWTQQDPSSHIGDLTQADAYTYVGGDPINNTDPSGHGFLSDLKSFACSWTIVAIACSGTMGTLNPEYAPDASDSEINTLVQSAENDIESALQDVPEFPVP